jgi:hypothetical protein
VRALRKGWLKIRKDDEDEEAKEPPVYLLWADDGRVADKTASGLTYIPPPKPPLPGHEESYNPPKEYIPTDVSRLMYPPCISFSVIFVVSSCHPSLCVQGIYSLKCSWLSL